MFRPIGYLRDDQRICKQRQVMAMLFERAERYNEDSFVESSNLRPMGVLESHGSIVARPPLPYRKRVQAIARTRRSAARGSRALQNMGINPSRLDSAPSHRIAVRF